MRGEWKALLKEGESVIQDTETGSATRDVGLIVSAQKVEHYEIAAYGSLRQLAKTIDKRRDFTHAGANTSRGKGNGHAIV